MKRGDSIQILRILEFYQKLSKGETVVKKAEAEWHEVSEKTIQRDAAYIRLFLDAKSIAGSELKCKKGAYYLEYKEDTWLNSAETLAVAKILLESRAFDKDKIIKILKKLESFCKLEDRNLLNELMEDELYHYQGLQHGKPVLQVLWDLSQAKREQHKVEVLYQKEFDETPSKRVLHPVGIIFSEFYFYLVAFQEGRDEEHPLTFRLDRIQSYTVSSDRFTVKYKKRIKEGELRQQLQFMQSGKLRTIYFKFWGESPQAVLDRLPTAQVVKKEGNVTYFKAEAYSRGIMMWLLSQGPYLEVTGPENFREEMRRTIEEMGKVYG